MDVEEIIFRKATHEDLHAIIVLLSVRGPSDLQRLISIPEPFQTSFLLSELAKDQIFVAVSKKDNSIVAQSNIFIVEDPAEQNNLLDTALRCTSDDRHLIEQGFFDHNHTFFYGDGDHFIPHQKILYIYSGSLFTHPNYRGRRISERLNAYVYEQLKKVTINKIYEHRYTAIALIYGIVEESCRRTASMARHFLTFVHSISSKLGHQLAKETSFYAYKSYKPDFTICPKGNLVQLPDEHCRPGRGCILLYELAGNSKK